MEFNSIDTGSDIFHDLMMGTNVTHSSAAQLAQQVSFGQVEFEDLFPQNDKELVSSPQDLEVNLDSPVSLDMRYESIDMSMFNPPQNDHLASPTLAGDNFNSSSSTAMSPSLNDGHSVVSSATPQPDLCPSPAAGQSNEDDELIEHDRKLLAERMLPYDKFPANNDWTLEQRVDRLLELSPCKRYTKKLLMNLDSVEDPEEKVNILIEVVSKIRLNFVWNQVQPHELHKPYTSASFCKKEKKKDAEGHVNPKRPMNAFMIWSKQCRSLISQICPQLHNATISKKLGVWWRKFSNEEKDVFEREKAVLTAFHAYEFPEYKYRPRKKACKKSDDKPEPSIKEKSSKKRKAQDTKTFTQGSEKQIQQPRQSPLKGINISEPRANLDPALQRKLQSKMNVKIDPDMRRDMSLSQGNRYTAINLVDLTSFQSAVDRSSSPITVKRLCLRPIEVQQTVPPTTVDLGENINRSTVFDTPGNSPHTPVTPVTPNNETSIGLVPATSQGQQCFDFTLSSTQRLMEHLTANNKVSTANQLVFPVGSLFKTPSVQNDTGKLVINNNNSINENNNDLFINNNNALQLQSNNVVVKRDFVSQNNHLAIKSEPIEPTWSLSVKTEPQWSVSVKAEPAHFSPVFVKSEPEVSNTVSMPIKSVLDIDSIHQLPMLSADTVDEAFHIVATDEVWFLCIKPVYNKVMSGFQAPVWRVRQCRVRIHDSRVPADLRADSLASDNREGVAQD
ncbi:transcription factor sox-6 [Plakobranchus ocellatus]|uniref:Sex-determining region Y protein n=1 Tax=Plakobranchus ocellatus TaxID=259542 RepID=A0AAV3ZID9_9GAST|nr:transcription factor sox-6 [Plakobranchus ocellatus]